MTNPADVARLSGLASRFGAFVAERHPFALADALEALEAAANGRALDDEASIEALRPTLRRELMRRLRARSLPPLPETTPRISAATRMEQAHAELLETCDGF